MRGSLLYIYLAPESECDVASPNHEVRDRQHEEIGPIKGVDEIREHINLETQTALDPADVPTPWQTGIDEEIGSTEPITDDVLEVSEDICPQTSPGIKRSEKKHRGQLADNQLSLNQSYYNRTKRAGLILRNMIRRGKREEIGTVLDARVKRGLKVGSDHSLLTVDKVWNDKARSKNVKPVKKLFIKSYRLREEEMAHYYQEEVERMSHEPERQWDSDDIEQSWLAFKSIILDASRLVCGEKSIRGNFKRTAWWTEEVKKVIQEKKAAWKSFLSQRTPLSHAKYKDKRKEAKQKVLQAKKKYMGRFWPENAKENQKVFYKVLKGMRKERQPTLKGIQDRNGEIIWQNEAIMERWREYIKELLDGTDASENETSNEDAAVWEEDVYICEEELQEAISKVKLDRSAGIEVTPEMIST